MKRTLALALSVLMLTASLAGCGNNGSKTPASASGSQAAAQSTPTTPQPANAWPERNVDMIIYSAAGGGTDLVNRLLATELGGTLGKTFVSSNMEGASGGVAATYVQAKPHDGYNLLGISEGLFPLAVLKCSSYTAEDWEYFIAGGTVGLISVATDSPYQTVQDVIDAMKSNPGKIKLANSQVGCIWDIKAALFKNATGVDYQFMSYQGSNPSILACLNGEVDVIVTGLGEQAEYLKAGKLRPLAVMEAEGTEVPTYGYVESIVETVPDLADTISSVSQAVGFAIPSDTDPAIIATLTDAFNKAMESDAMKQYAEEKYLTLTGLSGKDALELAKSMESTFSWILYDNGVATLSPEEFNISRP